MSGLDRLQNSEASVDSFWVLLHNIEDIFCYQEGSRVLNRKLIIILLLVCEPNVVQLSGTPFGDVNINFGGKLMSMGPNPEGFGSNLSRNPKCTKFFTVLTYVF